MKLGLATTALCLAIAGGAAFGEGSSVPTPGASAKIDEIVDRGALRVGLLAEFPFLVENTSGDGEQYGGPSWFLANQFADRLGVEVDVVPVSHETKVPILATGQIDLTIAPLWVTDARKEVVDFVIYSTSSMCMIGLETNPKLSGVEEIEDLNRDDLTLVYFAGGPTEYLVQPHFPDLVYRSVPSSGANAPIEELMSGRADIAPVDSAAWPQLAKAVPGLKVWPETDECLKGTILSNPVGMALDKNQAVFRDWMQAVADEIADETIGEQIRIMTSFE